MGQTHAIPLGGNTWSVGKQSKQGGNITKLGIRNWSESEQKFKTFFRVSKPGSLYLKSTMTVPSGKSRIAVKIGDTQRTFEVAGKSSMVNLGEWQLKDTGYVSIELTGVMREGPVYADVDNFQISGTSVDKNVKYVASDEGNFFYWGRRGPSVHLAYQVPENTNVEWYYNEVTVPEGEDVVGSYFMANGFTGGYFGIQVNSESERRVLFSVWSPYSTDNPEDIPEDQRIVLLRKGEGVHAGKFGNEGSGGQSYLRYNWKAGNTYKFLLRGVPKSNDHTEYTAWFYAPERGAWKLIASFSRPKTNSWLKGFHSFLENFIPNKGIYERRVLFSNQWYKSHSGDWREVTRAKFTADNTARQGYRMDYGGGSEGTSFFLRNCGFFSDFTPIGKYFDRTEIGRAPNVNLDKLP